MVIYFLSEKKNFVAFFLSAVALPCIKCNKSLPLWSRLVWLWLNVLRVTFVHPTSLIEKMLSNVKLIYSNRTPQPNHFSPFVSFFSSLYLPRPASRIVFTMSLTVAVAIISIQLTFIQCFYSLSLAGCNDSVTRKFITHCSNYSDVLW